MLHRIKHLLFPVVVVAFLIVASTLGARKAIDNARGQEFAVARTVVAQHVVAWEPVVEYESLSLRIQGPEGVVFEGDFDAGLPVIFDLVDRNGHYLLDATYTWELVATPRLDPAVRETLASARAAGDDTMAERLRAEGFLPTERLAQTGAFTIVNGSVVDPDLPEVVESRTDSSGYSLGAVAPTDQVVNDDKIIIGSLCVGFDCVNGESFGFDTIRLKENNLRIHFQDTSNSASFPTRDYRWVANDSSNGGANHMSLEDTDNSGRLTFRVFSGAPANSLTVDAQGDLGLGTANATVELHIVDGDTPTLRLEQDGSSGFTAQTWDVAGNETNFFIRDVTNGSRLPFRIRPNAPTSSLDIAGSTGNIGIGTTAPAAKLHIENTTGQDTDDFVVTSAGRMGIGTETPGNFIHVIGASGTNTTLMRLENTGGVTFRLDGGANNWDVDATDTGGYRISRAGSGAVEFQINNAGDVIIGGTTLMVPDYVFEPDYKLMPIEELGEFVMKNKHLPNVPNAKAIKTGGLNLGRFGTSLLEKIEELTLYTLQQHKTIEELKARLADLEAKTQN